MPRPKTKISKPTERSTRTSRGTRTGGTRRSSREETRVGREEKTRTGRGGGRKAPKQDNTKLIIAIGVGVFFFLVIVIAIVFSRGGDRGRSRSNKKSISKPSYSMPRATRKSIYKEYAKQFDAIELKAMEAQGMIPDGADRRVEGRKIDSKKKSDQGNLMKRIFNKYQKKHPKMPYSYFKEHIIGAGNSDKL